MFTGDLSAFYHELTLAMSASKPCKGILIVQQHAMDEEVVPGEAFLLSILPQLQKHGVKHIFLEKTPAELASIPSAKTIECNPRILGSSGLSMTVLHRIVNIAALNDYSAKYGIKVSGVDTDEYAHLPDILRIEQRERFMQNNLKKIASDQPFVMVAGLSHHKIAEHFAIPCIMLWGSKDNIMRIETHSKARGIVQAYIDDLNKNVAVSATVSSRARELTDFSVRKLNTLYPNLLVKFPVKREYYKNLERMPPSTGFSPTLIAGLTMGASALVLAAYYYFKAKNPDDPSPGT
ncbi:MAG: hypothetical protein Q7V63_00295 [Gammaproteobacteria bacterium]|nr:hypothetical protein [Gammaproteobacteria bacterium]